MAAGEFTAKTVRHAFFEREREACFRCRRSLRFEGRGFEWSAHHRMPRKSGGVGRKGSEFELMISGITNCLILCGHATTPGGCHAWVEQYRALAEDYGYIVRRGINPPAGVRIKKLDGSWWLLNKFGSAIECEGRADV